MVMKKQKKRTKAFNPNKHRVVINAAFKTINLAKPVTDEAKVKFNEQIHGAIEAITKGAGETWHFDVLASTVDVVYLMSQNLFNKAYNDEIYYAREAMFRMKDRFHKYNTFGFDGHGYNAIKELVAIHDEMMNHVTGAEVLAFMRARSNAIQGGNFYRSESERLAA